MRAAAADDGMTHSWLITGPPGSGRSILAYAFAAALIARPGDEARHNLGYWRGDDYLALGCAAYGTLSSNDGSAMRYRNTPDPRRYAEAARAGSPLVSSEEQLDPETRLRERIMLGLRLREGLDLDAAAESLGVTAWTDPRRRAADRLVASGRLEIDGGRLRLPKRAWIFADGIAASLF